MRMRHLARLLTANAFGMFVAARSRRRARISRQQNRTPVGQHQSLATVRIRARQLPPHEHLVIRGHATDRTRTKFAPAHNSFDRGAERSDRLDELALSGAVTVVIRGG